MPHRIETKWELHDRDFRSRTGEWSYAGTGKGWAEIDFADEPRDQPREQDRREPERRDRDEKMN